MENEKGGTVRYRRADYHPGTDEPWLVWFTKDQADPYWFTVEQGEAMGLTPPEPEPPSPIDTDVAELVELIDRYGAMGVALTLLAHDDITNVDDFLDSLLERWMELRDARQDPQPVDTAPPDDDLACWAWAIIANAGVHQGGWDHMHPEWVEAAEKWRDAFHASLRLDPQPAIDPEPAPAPSDTLDFDAMPIGTVAEVTLLDGDRLLALKDGDGPGYKWYVGDSSVVDITRLRDVRVVYRPAPVSPYEGLRAVLAGRDDADELLREARQLNPDGNSAWSRLIRAIGDAARGGAA